MIATGSRVNSLRSVEFAVTDLERSAKFYENVWLLKPVASVDGALYLRASGAEHHVVILREAHTPGLAAVDFGLANRTAVDELHAALESTPATVDDARALTTPGGGYGFGIRDTFGRVWRFSADVARHEPLPDVPHLPIKISHVVLNTPDLAADVSRAVNELGFRVRDTSKSMTFLGCNLDHHSLAFTTTQSVSVNHIAFDVSSIDAVMRGAGRLKHNGYDLQWGVGRHGPGANVFSYYLDPDSLPIEYTAEMMQIDDQTYRPGTPKDWERPPFFDAWGFAAPPTPRFRDASNGGLYANAGTAS